MNRISRFINRFGGPAGYIVAGLFVCMVSGADAPFADVVTIPAVRDNTLIENISGSLSDGSGENLFAGRTGQQVDSIRRGLVAFDLSRVVPSGATITSAVLTMHMSQTNTGPVRINLHRVLADWGEGASVGSGGGGAPAERGDATWIHTFFDDRFWALPGGDFESALSATEVIDQPGTYGWGSTVEMVADVQSWVNDPSGNYGWMLIGSERMNTTVKRFDSRENIDETLQPRLVVEFARSCKSGGLAGPGYWRRQCLGVPEEDGGISPSAKGRGPEIFKEPGFVDEILPCADAMLDDLGFDSITTCEAFVIDPPADCVWNAFREMTTLILNVCSDRTALSCEVPGGGKGCPTTTVGDRIEALAGVIRSGDCSRPSPCE